MPSYQQLLSQAQQYLMRGRMAEAEPLLKQVLALRSRNVDALVGMGLVCNATRRYTEAVDFFQQALAIQPYSLLANANIGASFHCLERFDDAVRAFQQYLTYQPDTPVVLYNLGTSLKPLGRLEEAAAALRRAIALKPDYAEAYYNLGNVLQDQQKIDEAIAAYEQAVRIRPAYAEAWNNTGSALRKQGKLDEALAMFRKAMALKPDYPDPLGGVAATLRDLGQVEEAMVPFRHYLERAPQDQVLYSGYLLSLEYPPGQKPEFVFEEHVRWAKRYADPAKVPASTHANDRSPARRLRIGYVSPDFRQHAVAFFLEDILALHDPAEVEVFCYNTNRFTDAVTERFKGYAHHWRDVSMLKDPQIAEQIRADQIDLLVDLAGHTAGNRLLALATRPAPVQVSYLGYIDTTGMSQIDYRLCDEHTDPPGATEHLHTETLVRLPHAFACYRPHAEMGDVSPLPALAAGHVTFGAFSIAAKMNAPLISTWAEILSQVPGSRLILAGNGLLNASVQKRTHSIMEAAGIGRDRLEFYGSRPLPEYFASHHRVDILLDPFPVAGHTISCNALWMGVPVVSLEGIKYASRLGVSVLTNMQLTELLAKTREEYIEKAVALASDLPRLQQLRATLRDRLRHSPIMDAPAFVRNLEAAYRRMWHTWCSR
ncbi:MAG: O-linked N-acetylglucosamine transferase family protein [Phycisphaerae bacterium]